MATETLQYYLFKLFKKISEKFANFYLTLTQLRERLTAKIPDGIIIMVEKVLKIFEPDKIMRRI